MKRCLILSLLITSAPLHTVVADVSAIPMSPVLTAPASTTSRNTFLEINDFSNWTRSAGTLPCEVVLTSPLITPSLHWDQMVPSWNAALPAGAYLTLEATALTEATPGQPPHVTKTYSFGKWSSDVTRQPRGSINKQGDDDGTIDTDTLILKQRGASLRLRLTLGADEKSGLKGADLVPLLRFMGFAFTDSTAAKTTETPNKAAWGKTVPVPERFQMDYRDIGGAVWCSPTSVSMILAHWSDLTKRSELTLTIPQVAHAVNDPQWPGTGNWAFNVAFAGSFPGIRAYVARFDDLQEVEDWIAAGVPVALSVNYGLLKGTPDKGGGHLVVCNGFTANGDVIIADPGRNPLPGEKYRVFPRADVLAGWGASGNTVYLVYPESTVVPANVMHHWVGQGLVLK